MRRKVVFVIPSLGLGGMERAMATLLKHADHDAFNFTVITWGRGPISHELTVRVIQLETDPPWSFPYLLLQLWEEVSCIQPQVVVGWGDYCNWLVALLPGRFKRVMTEHIHPTEHLKRIPGFIRRVGERLMRQLYHRADAVVAVSMGVATDLMVNFGIHQVHMVPCPIDFERIEALAKEPIFDWPAKGPAVVFVGRLAPQKDVMTLIRAMQEVRYSRPVELVIVGDGPERFALENEVERQGLEWEVHFIGSRKNPYPYMKRAAMLALSSTYEGFSLVLREALALGIPVVSTNCPSGPSDVVKHGVNGYLVPVGNPEEMSKAIWTMLMSPRTAKRPTGCEPAVVWQSWKHLLK